MSQHEPEGGGGLEELLRQRAQAAIEGAKLRHVERENRRQCDAYVHRIFFRLASKLGWFEEEKKEREKMRQKAMSWEKANTSSGAEGSRRRERKERKEGRRKAASNNSYEEVPGGGQFIMMLLNKEKAAGKQVASQEDASTCLPSTEDRSSRKQSEGDESSSLHSDPAILQVSSGQSPMLGPTAQGGSKGGSSPVLGPAAASKQPKATPATGSKGKQKGFGASGSSEVSKASSKILGKVSGECGAAAEGACSQVRGDRPGSGSEQRRGAAQAPSSSRQSPSMAPANAPGWYSGSSSTWTASSSGYATAAPSTSSPWQDWKAEKSTPPRSRAATASSGSPGFGPSASLGRAAAELEEQRQWEKTKVFELPEFFREGPLASRGAASSAAGGRSRGNTWDDGGGRYWDELPPGALGGLEDEPPGEVLKPAGRRRRGVVPSVETEGIWQ